MRPWRRSISRVAGSRASVGVDLEACGDGGEGEEEEEEEEEEKKKKSG